MIEIAPGDFIAPENVFRVRKIDDRRTALWSTGQSALDNCIVEVPVLELVEMIHDAIYGPEEELEEDEPPF